MDKPQKNFKKVRPVYRPNAEEMKEFDELTRRQEGFEAFEPIPWEEEELIPAGRDQT